MGPAMRPAGCGTADEPVRRSTRAWTDACRGRRPSPAVVMPVETLAARSWNAAHAAAACSSAPRVSALGPRPPIRPVLKHDQGVSTCVRVNWPQNP